MSNFPIWWNQICQLPQNDGNPPGYGWTYPTWVDARRFAGYQDVSQATYANMTQADAGSLAEVFFWDRLGGLWLASGPDVCVVDWMWNSGYAAGFDIQQKLLLAKNPALDVDGIIGPTSSHALNAVGTPLAVAQQVCALRTQFLLDCGFTEQSERGLFTRTMLCLTVAEQLIGGSA